MDASLFKSKVLPCAEKMYFVALRYLEDTDAAHDAVQDAFLKLWNRRHTLSSVANMEAFSITVVRNVCIDMLKSAGARENDEDLSPEMSVDNDNALTAITRKEDVDRVMSIIDTLPTRQKMVIKMRTLDEMSFDEIENATGLTSVNIRSLLSRARKRIKECFYEK